MLCKFTYAGPMHILVQAQVMILWQILNTLTKFLSTVRVWIGGIVGTLFFNQHFQTWSKILTLEVYCSRFLRHFGHECGRHGSERADIKPGRSHELKEGF